MKIASYLPLTLCDYPGKVAAIVFTQGCNFACPWCHNKHLIDCVGLAGTLAPTTENQGRGERPCEPLNGKNILAEVSARCRAGTLDGLVITGGEPTIQPDFLNFLRECKSSGIPIKLDTNGSNPSILRECFAEGLVAFVAMDVKAPLEKYTALCGVPVNTNAIRESIGLIVESGLPHQFRTTVVPDLLDEADIEKTRALLPRGEVLVLQEYRDI